MTVSYRKFSKWQLAEWLYRISYDTLQNDPLKKNTLQNDTNETYLNDIQRLETITLILQVVILLSFVMPNVVAPSTELKLLLR